VNAHRFLTRPSADVDLFGALDADLSTASAAVVSQYRTSGLAVTVEHESTYYVRLTVADPETGRESKVELVADIRLREPVRMAIGPVLHPDDVAAGKIEALYSRACRDFVDVDALLRSGHVTRGRLLALAEQRDTGFDRAVFAQMLAGIDRFPDAEFARYEVSPERAPLPFAPPYASGVTSSRRGWLMGDGRPPATRTPGGLPVNSTLREAGQPARGS
jgi:hypothetical protein